ncbi:uncharacterized protein B0I36DRAFT_356138 [Microdochium trichocladiopsis]|uniref:Uncharacterized protein n=1 Tax=Microdochium trichocladiopsis TaxID=1682393 RepID=A0A9P9BHK4_9PEZI|nr:uncharacterized protein B0I36DRAFT_356138 [Microdochium trichocladiopsis]KAH7012034.1 hypothetical protein B0I36DRAFT_356138 [Microdochium trichocladiopsis]
MDANYNALRASNVWHRAPVSEDCVEGMRLCYAYGRPTTKLMLETSLTSGYPALYGGLSGCRTTTKAQFQSPCAATILGPVMIGAPDFGNFCTKISPLAAFVDVYLPPVWSPAVNYADKGHAMVATQPPAPTGTFAASLTGYRHRFPASTELVAHGTAHYYGCITLHHRNGPGLSFFTHVCRNVILRLSNGNPDSLDLRLRLNWPDDACLESSASCKVTNIMASCKDSTYMLHEYVKFMYADPMGYDSLAQSSQMPSSPGSPHPTPSS